MLPTGDYFGGRAAELAGIVIHPNAQGCSLGTSLIESYIADTRPNRLIAYTRNPSLLRAVGHACAVADVLEHQYPHEVAASIPDATLADDNYIYHIGRYAPHGLYGAFDPAQGTYNGQRLDQRCRYVTDPNNALAISVETRR
ncbi:MAG TPA: hypothetical protein VIQ80_00830 [Candidatus Saccharimonadales bacterium]